MSIDFYERNADKFCDDTFDVDMTSIYEPFLSRLALGASILDAGCGSGRDSKFFAGLGYKVTAFDASEQIVYRARQLTGLDIQLKKFDQLDEVCVYDGIWSCASLLHIPLTELPKAMQQLACSLKKSGVWYLSFKYGHGERKKDGRHFTDLDEEGLRLTVNQLEGISIEKLWTTKDKRAERHDVWLNAILLK
jgi:SAM-dependent methyltransferase